MKYLLGLGLLAISMVFFNTHSIPLASAESCRDLKYADDPLKMPGTHHDDNSPSEKELKQKIKGDATLCEIAKCYDNDDCTGELTGKELKEFYKSIAFETGSEDQQDCLKHRGNLPDGGEKALQAYEIFDCGVKNY